MSGWVTYQLGPVLALIYACIHITCDLPMRMHVPLDRVARNRLLRTTASTTMETSRGETRACCCEGMHGTQYLTPPPPHQQCGVSVRALRHDKHAGASNTGASLGFVEQSYPIVLTQLMLDTFA